MLWAEAYSFTSRVRGNPRRILPVPPAPAVFDQRVIHVRPIWEENFSNGAFVLVLAECLECHLFAEHQLRRRLLRARAVGLALL